MRFGCCAGLATFVPPTLEGQQDSLSVAHAKQCDKIPALLDLLGDAGFEYVEFGVGMVAPEQPEADYGRFLERVGDSPLRPEVFSSFIPSWIKVAGPDVDWARLERYVSTATQRVRNAGGDRIIFGSGGARSRPEDWPTEKAESQLRRFINLAADYCEERGIVLCIEPLNASETNVINLVAEAAEWARSMSRPGVRVLADCFHMGMEDEPFEHIIDCGDLLAHAHVADRNRRYPDDFGYDIDGFFAALKEAGYNGRVSIEANFDDITTEAPAGLERIKRAAQ